MTKNDFSVFKEHVDNRFNQFQTQMDYRFELFQTQMDSRFEQFQAQIDRRFTEIGYKIMESEFRTVTRLGALLVGSLSIAVAILAWLIKT